MLKRRQENLFITTTKEHKSLAFYDPVLLFSAWKITTRVLLAMVRCKTSVNSYRDKMHHSRQQTWKKVLWQWMFWILSKKEFQIPVNTDISHTLKDDTEVDLNKLVRIKMPFLVHIIDLALLIIMLRYP